VDKPLEGIRVLEVAQFWMVPSGGAILADLGAEVLKIEHPVVGDGARGVITYGGFPQGSLNFMWEQPNRGKRSVGLDLRNPAGLEVLYRLAETSDVLLTNYLAAARAKLKIDVEDIRTVNPDIVYVRGSGQGSHGPEANAAAYDSTAFWARSSVADRLTPPGYHEPIQQRPAFGDGTTGIAVAAAVMGALLVRARTGRAPVADVSLLSAGLWVMSPDLCAAALHEAGLTRSSRLTAANPLVNSYRTSDGRWILLSLLQADLHWKDLCRVIDRPDLVDDPRFSEMSVRNQHAAECRQLLEEVFAQRSLAEWQERLADFSGPWQTMQTPHEVLEDPQVLANGYIPEVVYDDGRRTRLVAAPIQFDEQPPELSPAPELGQHTEEILLELGYDWDVLGRLKASGAIS